MPRDMTAQGPGGVAVWLLAAAALACAGSATVVAAMARDFAAIHLGPANAEAAAEALLATADASGR